MSQYLRGGGAMRLTRKDPIPHHYEAVTLCPAPRVLGWCGGFLLAATGVAANILGCSSFVRSVVGPLLGTGGVLLLAAVWRLGTYEIVVTDAGLRAGPSLIGRWFPRGELASTTPRPATGWRRLYARNEILTTFSQESGIPPLALPSRAPKELQAALAPDLATPA